MSPKLQLEQLLRRATQKSCTTCKIDEVILFLDEYDTYDLADKNIENALRTDRGNGVGIWMCGQSLPQDEDLCEAVIQNTGVKIVHRCASKQTATVMAESMLSELQRMKVHHYTNRQVHDGYESKFTSSISPNHEGKPIERISESLVGRYREEKVPSYESLGDQQTLLVKEIQNLQVGERIIIDGRTT